MATITPGGQPYRAPEGPVKAKPRRASRRQVELARARARAAAPSPSRIRAAAAAPLLPGDDDNPTGLPPGVMYQPPTTWAGNPLPGAAPGFEVGIPTPAEAAAANAAAAITPLVPNRAGGPDVMQGPLPPGFPARPGPDMPDGRGGFDPRLIFQLLQALMQRQGRR